MLKYRDRAPLNPNFIQKLSCQGTYHLFAYIFCLEIRILQMLLPLALCFCTDFNFITSGIALNFFKNVRKFVPQIQHARRNSNTRFMYSSFRFFYVKFLFLPAIYRDCPLRIFLLVKVTQTSSTP